MTCPQCGEPIAAGDAFCENCGAALAATPSEPVTSSTETPARSCTACGGEVGEDGWCTVCGARASNGREHVVEQPSPTVVGVSDKGLLHARNEDACALASDGTWTALVVCDGVTTSTFDELIRDGALWDEASAQAGRRDMYFGPFVLVVERDPVVAQDQQALATPLAVSDESECADALCDPEQDLFWLHRPSGSLDDNRYPILSTRVRHDLSELKNYAHLIIRPWLSSRYRHG